MKMKRPGLLILSTLLLTGCSFNNNNDESHSETNVDGVIKEDVRIEFMCMLSDEYRTYLETIIKKFEETEPHVKVTLSNPQGSGNYAMLEKTVIAGFYKEEYPDIVQCYPDNVVKYLAKGYAYNLDEYINNKTYGLSEEDMDDYISSFIKEGQQYKEEGTYSLPYCKSTELMYYNAEVLLGLEIDGVNDNNPIDEEYLNNLSWKELFDNLCPKLEEYNETLPDEDKILSTNEPHAIVTYDSDENLFITLAEQYGYGYTSYDQENDIASIDFDNPGMKELVRKLKDAKDKRYFETKKSCGNYVSELFQTKDCLFTISSTAGLSAYIYNETNPYLVGVAKIPHAEGNDYYSINQGPSICVLDHFDNNRSLASFLLWKYMTNKENSSSWSIQTGYMAIRNSSYQTEEYKNSLIIKDETDLKNVAEVNNRIMIAEVKESTFNTPVFKGSGNARTNVGLLIRDCLLSNDLDAEIDDIFTYYAEDARTYIN